MRPCLALLAAGVLGLLAACQGPTQPESQAPDPSPPAVKVARAEMGQVAACIQTTGTLDPHRESKVGPRIAGTVERVLVEEGARVKEGDPLVELDTAAARLTVEEARAALAVADAQLRQILTGSRPEIVGQAQAKLQETQALLDNAASDRRRVENLYGKGSVPRKSLDQAVAQNEAAEAAFLAAREGLRMAKTGATQEEVQVARAHVERARATLHRAEQVLTDSLIRSPFSGVVIRKFVNEGEYVNTLGQNPLLWLMAIDLLELKVQVPEIHRQDVAIGNEVEVRPDALHGRVFHGRVTEVIPAVDPLNRTFRVVVKIPNPDHGLAPGMFCRVRLSTCGGGLVLRVPRSAVLYQEGQSLVYLVQGERVRRRAVVLGAQDEGYSEVASGLAEGDQVVVHVEGGAILEEGTHVVISASKHPRPIGFPFTG